MTCLDLYDNEIPNHDQFKEGNHIRTLGKVGEQPGIFSCPCGLVLTKDHILLLCLCVIYLDYNFVYNLCFTKISLIYYNNTDETHTLLFALLDVVDSSVDKF